MAHLVFYRDGAEMLRFPLSADEVRLGRHSENDISLPDPEISRFHALLVKQGESYRLENISRIGILINEKPIETHRLEPQDVFCIGRWRILYEMSPTLDDQETKVGSSNDSPKLFCHMVGESRPMRQLFELIEKGAQSDLPVMIQGETGTGKELVARAIHEKSGRHGPCVALNCGAISPNLIESELFGHERGAFTGAVSQHKGAFEQAEGGTLFLDEMGELPLELQSKLLRVLEDGSFKRVGGTTELKADVRIVSATHRDLQLLVRAGEFREDLFYRLMGLPVILPPLRERGDDINHLAQFFMRENSPVAMHKELSATALARLQSYEWPGNVRELKNVLARSLLLSSGSILEDEDLHFLPTLSKADDRSLEGREKETIVETLRATAGNKKRAAERLGIAKSTLFRKIKEYGLSEF